MPAFLFVTLFDSCGSPSNRIMSLSSIGLTPGPIASKSNSASTPVPFAATPGPIRVSAVNDTVPVALSIVPGMKKVEPPLGKKGPSVELVAESTLGLKSKSNWNGVKVGHIRDAHVQGQRIPGKCGYCERLNADCGIRKCLPR